MLYEADRKNMFPLVPAGIFISANSCVSLNKYEAAISDQSRRVMFPEGGVYTKADRTRLLGPTRNIPVVEELTRLCLFMSSNGVSHLSQTCKL